jgi:hypothetical protein
MHTDAPIEKSTEDILDRAGQASKIAETIKSWDVAKDSMTVAIRGPWGSGKTSFMNLVAEKIEGSGIVVHHFNPWLLSEGNDLTNAFLKDFVGLISNNNKLKEIAQDLEDLASVVTGVSESIPILSTIVKLGLFSSGAEGVKQVAAVAQRRLGDIEGIRKKIGEKLRAQDTRYMFVIDDVDRLHPSEVVQVFKLVRNVARFPRFIFLIAYDHNRVVSQLKEANFEGEGFLEKIVQLPVDIPKISEEQLRVFLSEELALIFGQAEFRSIQSGPLFQDAVLPHVKSLRDIKRLSLRCNVAYAIFREHINTEDFLVLECFRTLNIGLFYAIEQYGEQLCQREAEDSIFYTDIENEAEKWKVFEEAAGTFGPSTRSALTILFPSVTKGDLPPNYLLKRRICDKFIFRKFFQNYEGIPLQALTFAEQINALKTREEVEALLAARIGIPSILRKAIPHLESLPRPNSEVCIAIATWFVHNHAVVYDRSATAGESESEEQLYLLFMHFFGDLTPLFMGGIVNEIMRECNSISEVLVLYEFLSFADRFQEIQKYVDALKTLEFDIKDRYTSSTNAQLASEVRLFWVFDFLKRANPNFMDASLKRKLTDPAVVAALIATCPRNSFQSGPNKSWNYVLNLRELEVLVGGADSVSNLISVLEKDDSDLSKSALISIKNAQSNRNLSRM